MLNTTPMQLYQHITGLCKTYISSSNAACEKSAQSWELPEGVRCDIFMCGLCSLFAALELKLRLLGSTLCLDVAHLEPVLCL